MKQYSTTYIFIFAAALCLACSTMISAAYVGLRERQDENRLLDKQKSVLIACQKIKTGEKISREEILKRFSNIEAKVIDLATGKYVEGVDPDAFDEDAVEKVPAPKNAAQVLEIPKQVKIYRVMDGDHLGMMVLPIYGKGLWSTLYGFLALDADGNTVRGLTYYQHGETPGLGGEVDNPKWKNRWPGRKIFGEDGSVKLHVIKGQAGPATENPYEVDGLSGATLTSRGVSNMLQFWFGKDGYGPYLDQYRKNGSA